jgi:hypothetical protein
MKEIKGRKWEKEKRRGDRGEKKGEETEGVETGEGMRKRGRRKREDILVALG